MNSVDMAMNLIHRAKNLQEFVVTTDVPDGFRFNGLVPFDITISKGTLSATVYALDFDEAVQILSDYIEGCK
jgi:hypothetical protein